MFLDFIRFSSSITVKFTRNIAANIANKNRAKNRDTLIEQSLTTESEKLLWLLYKNISILAIKWVMIAAGDYPLDFFHPVLMVGHFCCNGQPMLRYSCCADIFCYSWKSILYSRHEAIMLQKLSIMLLSSAPKINYYAFEKVPIVPKIMPLILANNASL